MCSRVHHRSFRPCCQRLLSCSLRCTSEAYWSAVSNLDFSFGVFVWLGSMTFNGAPGRSGGLVSIVEQLPAVVGQESSTISRSGCASQRNCRYISSGSADTDRQVKVGPACSLA